MNSEEAGKRIEKIEEEIDQIQPELSALRDNLVKYEIASSGERIAYEEKRQRLDIIIVTWRDILHSGLKSPGSMDMIHLIHKVIDNMDDYLNRERGRRK